MGSKHYVFAAIVGLALAAVSGGSLNAAEGEPTSDVVAIDVLLHPDQTMLAVAAKANKELRANYPDGFKLDAQHTPHISMVQRYVRRADLKRVYAALEQVFKKNEPAKLSLEATGYFSFPMGAEGLAGIVVKPTDELRELQRQIVAAVEPFAVEGTAAGFVPSPDGAEIVPSMVVYVNEYVEKRTGKNFNPHVTVGLGAATYVEKMIEAPFKAFAFKPTGASVYHLGNYGTAAKELWSSPR